MSPLLLYLPCFFCFLQDFPDFLRVIADICLCQLEGIQNCFLRLCNCMVQPIYSVQMAYHHDFFPALSKLQNDFPDKTLHSLDHDKKAISHLIHVCQVLPAEITPVQDESQIPVSEAVCLINHAGKLRHVIDASGILFIKQRLPVGYVKSHRVVIDGLPCIHLCISILQKVDVSHLTVFVCGIIGNIDLLAFVSSFVPGIQKTDDLLRSMSPISSQFLQEIFFCYI